MVKTNRYLSPQNMQWSIRDFFFCQILQFNSVFKSYSSIFTLIRHNIMTTNTDYLFITATVSGWDILGNK